MNNEGNRIKLGEKREVEIGGENSSAPRRGDLNLILKVEGLGEDVPVSIPIAGASEPAGPNPSLPYL